MLRQTWIVAVAIVVTAADVRAQEPSGNWPQWRGPRANGIAPDADPPIRWSEDENIRWKVEIPGSGSATPIVWGNRIFLLTAILSESESDVAGPGEPPRPRRGRRGGPPRPEVPTTPVQFVVLCLDRETGETVWRKVAREAVPHEGHHETNTFASGSPVTDGQHLYASFGSYGIYCYDLDGNLKWERDLGDMQTRNGFGEGSSPVLHGDTLVVAWDHEADSFITALDAATGEPKWKVPRDEPTTWSTPLIVEHDGRVQVVTNGTNRARGYDLETGDLLWECGGQVTNPIPSPLVHNEIAYCVSGYRGFAVYAIPLDSRGDLTGTDQPLWHRDDIGSYISSPILADGLLYVTKSRDAIVTCLDAKTGETVADQQRLQGLRTLYASPIAAAGRLYYVDRDGAAVVLKAGPELEVLATNQLDDGFDASPVALGKTLYLRGMKHLYCIEEK